MAEHHGVDRAVAKVAGNVAPLPGSVDAPIGSGWRCSQRGSLTPNRDGPASLFSDRVESARSTPSADGTAPGR